MSRTHQKSSLALDKDGGKDTVGLKLLITKWGEGRR